MTDKQTCAPDGSSRPVRIVAAAQKADGELTLRCSQVSGEGERVSCLAHLDEETLAAASVRVEHEGKRYISLQRGNCAVCPLAIKTHEGEDLPNVMVPSQVVATTRGAQELLERSGAGGEDLFRVTPVIGEPDSQGFSRRDLFRLENYDEDLSVPAPSAPRGVLLAALPGAMVNHPVAAPGCTGCRICEQICPEDAFGWSGVGTNGVLWVSPADCTACGMCVQACPEDVLSLQALTPADGAQHIARILPRGCAKCGRGLSPGEEDVCTSCSSRRNLLDDVWKHLG